MPMRSPGRAAGGDCSVDPGCGCLPHGLRPGAGGGAGPCVRLSAAPASPAYPPVRQRFSGRRHLGVGVSVLRNLRRGHPGRLCLRPGGGGHGLGEHRRTAPAPGFYPDLEDFGRSSQTASSANEKIFRIFEISICICGKMGYNSKKPFETAPAPARRENQ